MRSDDELMGEPAGFDELVKRYEGRLRDYFRRSLLDAAAAEDLAQETFLRVHRERERYRPEGRFRSWIFRIAHNLLVAEFERRRVRIDRPIDSAPEETAPPPAAVARDEDLRRVHEAMRSLPPAFREALILAYFERLPYAEIAELTGTTEGNVAVRVHTALARLREKLG